MNININFGERTPIYEQIIKEIERQVTLGILKPNSQIPSIRDLAHALGINPNTVKKAYDILENKKVIITKSTKGTYITENIEEARDTKIEELILELKIKIKELEKYGLTKEEILKRLK